MAWILVNIDKDSITSIYLIIIAINNSIHVIIIYFYIKLLASFNKVNAFELLDNDLILIGAGNGKYHIADAISTYYHEKKAYFLTD